MQHSSTGELWLPEYSNAIEDSISRARAVEPPLWSEGANVLEAMPARGVILGDSVPCFIVKAFPRYIEHSCSVCQLHAPRHGIDRLCGSGCVASTLLLSLKLELQHYHCIMSSKSNAMYLETWLQAAWYITPAAPSILCGVAVTVGLHLDDQSCDHPEPKLESREANSSVMSPVLRE